MKELKDLLPIKKARIMDLLEIAGIDISDWGNFRGGLAKASTNPKYCYEWAFYQEGKQAVICLWFDSIEVKSGKVVSTLNLREVAKDHSSNHIVVLRARRMDTILKKVYENKTDLKVVIGSRRINDRSAKVKPVEKRHLDSMPWYIVSYDNFTGVCQLERGSSSEISVSDFVRCLENIKLSKMEIRLLQEIYNFINHESNARVLAHEKFGYKSLVQVNNNIGGIAKKIVNFLNLSRESSTQNGREHHLLILVDRIEDGQTIIWKMKPQLARALEICKFVDPREDWFPMLDEEPIVINEDLGEGGRKVVTVNVYERSREARKICLQVHGVVCKVCDFNFESIYGDIGKGFIHVHHLVPISESKGTYHIDPKKDLCPVCPNCHAMLHTQRPPLSIEQLRERLSNRQ